MLLRAAAREELLGDAETGTVKEPESDLTGVCTVLAALQNYAGWRADVTKLLKSGEDTYSSWDGGPTSMGKLSDTLLGQGKLAQSLDQCLSVALMHGLFPAMKVAYLANAKVNHETVVTSVLLTGSLVDTSAKESGPIEPTVR
jgi:hypothetical protein